MEDRFETSHTFPVSPEELWGVLTESDKIQRYMYDCRLVGKWEPGETIAFVLQRDGRDVTMVHGEVLAVHPPNTLEHTLFPTTWEGMEDIPENHLRIRYEIEEQGDHSVLRITQTGFATAAAGQERLEHTRQGWEDIFTKMEAVVSA